MVKLFSRTLFLLLWPIGNLLGQSTGEEDVVFIVDNHCRDAKLVPERDTLQLEFDSARLSNVYSARRGGDTAAPHNTAFCFALNQCQPRLIDSVSTTCGEIVLQDSVAILRIADNEYNPFVSVNLYSHSKLLYTKKMAVSRAIIPPRPNFTRGCDCDSLPVKFFLYESIELVDRGSIEKSAIKNTVLGRRSYQMPAIAIPSRLTRNCYLVYQSRINATYRDKKGRHRINEWLGDSKSMWRRLSARGFPTNTELTFSFKYKRLQVCPSAKYGRAIRRISPSYLALLRPHKKRITVTLQP